MRGVILLWKEIKELYTFFKKTKKIERQIVFYSEDVASYTYFEGLINHLTNHYKLKIVYVTSDSSDPILSTDNPHIKSFYIKHLLALFIKLLDSKMLIMTMPDLNQFHIKRSLRGAEHIYIFHSIGSSFAFIRHGALFHYDTIFCVGPHHIKETRIQEKLYNLQEKKLVKFGYYRLEKVYNDYKKRPQKKSKYKARILVAPSWGPDSILDTCGSKLIRTLLEADYEVIVRPHPMTNLKNPIVLKSLNKEFKSFKNYIYEGDIASTDSFYESDVLISDWSGVIYEYAFGTERPVLFIDVPMKVVNPHYKKLNLEPIDVSIRKQLGIILKLNEIQKIDSAITKLLNNPSKYKNSIIKARNTFVYNFGTSSSVGAKYIYNRLQQS